MKQKLKKSGVSLGALAGTIAELFPPRLAESWDNVGLQIGDPAKMVHNVMTCLEVTDPIIAEAKRRKADAIVAHHPLIFRPFKTLLESRPAERLAAELVRARIGLIVAHTNMDAAPWGTNQILAEACGLTPVGPLDPRSSSDSETCKFVVFTPRGYEDAVIEAIHRGGGGRIGLYTHCTFRAEGTGTFLGGEGTKPFIGRKGKFEQASEWRLESVVPLLSRAKVLEEVRKVHPYEEPAYEFYLLAGQDNGAGLGCIAVTAKPTKLGELVSTIKKKMKLAQVRISGPAGLTRRVTKVAICSGSGGSFLAKAAASGAEVYVTGEINYHSGVEAAQRSITVIEVGHFESERIMAPALAHKMNAAAYSNLKSVIEFFPAKEDFQPFVAL